MGVANDEKYELDDDVSSPSTPDKSARSSSDSSSSHEPTDGLLKEVTTDLESQQPTPAENYVSTRTKLAFLAAYFFLNLFLTLSNKSVLGKVRWGIWTRFCA